MNSNNAWGGRSERVRELESLLRSFNAEEHSKERQVQVQNLSLEGKESRRRKGKIVVATIESANGCVIDSLPYHTSLVRLGSSFQW